MAKPLRGAKLAVALAALAALVPAFGLSGCAERRAAGARDRALRYFSRDVPHVDHRWAPLFDYMHRRFGLELMLADGSTPYGAPGRAGDAFSGIYRRVVDPHARATREQVAALPTAIDRITATALHCDTLGIPADWLEVLRKATRAGAYALTHAVLALQWTLENGCLPEIAAVALQAEQAERLEALASDRAALLENALGLDIWLEAIAMLHYLGEGGRVRGAWIDDLLGLQRPDGGWPNHPRDARSHPHPTALALWILLEELEPEAPRVAWLARG